MLLHSPGMLSGIRPAKTGAITGAVMSMSTTQAKFGTTSLYNNGTASNYASVTPVTNFAFGTGDFTIEFWYYTEVRGTGQSLIGFRPTGVNGNYITLLTNFPTGNASVTFYSNGVRIISPATSIVNNTWMNIALVRSSGTTKMYINGTQSGSSYTDSTSYLASQCIIGSDDYNTANTPLYGYIDELRISNIARYTANYTVATEPFIDDANTLLLYHFEQANGSKNLIDDNS